MPAIKLVDAIPLAKDAHGVYRVGGTRVTLDIVVRAFNQGATAGEIVQEFPSLQLPDVYQGDRLLFKAQGFELLLLMASQSVGNRRDCYRAAT